MLGTVCTHHSSLLVLSTPFYKQLVSTCVRYLFTSVDWIETYYCHLITFQPHPALDGYKYCEWVLIGYQFWNQTGTYNIMAEGDYMDYSIVKSYKCGCYTLFAYNTKQGEFEPLVIHCCEGKGSMDKAVYESIIVPIMKIILERRRLQRQSSTQRTVGWRGVATNFVIRLLFEI